MIRLLASLLIALLPLEVLAQSRSVLTDDLTYYVRTDGSDSNDCLSDSPGGACLTWQHAVDLAARLDLMGHTVTIQHGAEDGPKTFTANTRIKAMTGGGGLHLLGSPRPGNTVINVTGEDCFTLYGVGAPVTFDQMTLVGGGGGQINVAYSSAAIIGGAMIFGAAPNSLAHVYVHDKLAIALLLLANYKITGGTGNAHVFVNAGMVFHERSAVTLIGTPKFPGAFIAATNGGTVQAAGSTFSGAAIGSRYAAAGNAVINVYGGGPDIFPGSSAGVTSTGGQYIP